MRTSNGTNPHTKDASPPPFPESILLRDKASSSAAILKLSKHTARLTANFLVGKGPSPNDAKVQQSRSLKIPTHSRVFPDGIMIETVRDHLRPENCRLVVFKDQTAVIKDQFERDGSLFVPGKINRSISPYLRLPTRVKPCGRPRELITEIVATLQRYIDISDEDLLIVAAFILSSWFADCHRVAPYIWLVGPLGSGKTTLLKLLQALCRRVFLIGNLTPAALYQLPGVLCPTLLIDENDTSNSQMSLEVQRLLLIGNVPGTPAIRNGIAYEPYCMKVISSREPPSDGALASRAIMIGIAPTIQELAPLDDVTREQIAEEFQGKLLQFRMQEFSRLGVSETFSSEAKGMTSHMRDLAHALAVPFLGDVELEKELLETLRRKDSDARVYRSLEPEWLVTEALFRLCHQDSTRWEPLPGRFVSITVGGISSMINGMMADRGEEQRLQPRKVGSIMRALGIRTKSLGNTGRGIEMSTDVYEQVHKLAQRMGLSRKNLLSLIGCEPEYGGAPCKLCEKFGLTAGLKFVELAKPAAVRPIRTPRPFFSRKRKP